MADYSTLKAAITAVIRTNYNEEITGQILQDVLIGVVDALGSGYLLMGVATPATSPGTPDENVVYLAATNGTYTNFGGLTVGDEIALLVWDGSWHKQSLANAFTAAERTKLAGIEAGAQVNPPIDSALNDSSANAVENAVITAAINAIYATLETKANATGDYPAMSVGTAQGLRGKTIAEMFLNRIVANGKSGNGAATIQTIKGKTLKWNQICANGDFSNGTTGWANIESITDGVAHIIGTTESASATVNLTLRSITYVKDHKYLFRGFIKGVFGKINIVPSGSTADGTMGYVEVSTTVFDALSYIWTCPELDTYTRQLQFRAFSDGVVGTPEFYAKNVTIFDLTDFFGSGNEPTTVAEFEALYPLPYYAYNPGELLSLKATGLQVKDANDVETGTLPLPLTTKTGKLNGEGTSVIPFADGMNAVGSVYDEATKTKGVKRLGIVDLGTLSWVLVEGSQFKTSGLVGIVAEPESTSAMSIIRCSKYDAVSGNNFVNADKVIRVMQAPQTAHGQIRLIDSAHTTAPTESDNWLSGVYLVYELATPEEYVWDEPLEINYPVDKDGTETVLPIGVDANGVPNTAPLDATIVYPVSAEQMISAESMTGLLEALKTAGVISAYTMAWNTTTEKYDFTITA